MTNHELETLLAIDRDKLPADGGSRYNRLIFSRSPYLLQHAENPVDWREWGAEAREEAVRRNVPLFVSTGYATCHWCHVMAHESFEDDEVADILNHCFVPVKVDREERPDVDEFCMAACQAMTGSGGWPLNCFLKPDGTPFYAFTYLPKNPCRSVPGFLELLENIANIWQQRPGAVESNARSLMETLETSASKSYLAVSADRELLSMLSDRAAATLQKIYDKRYGGFGQSPKFPMPPYLLFLLGRENQADRQMAFFTLKAIGKGGICDQLGGGVHRYSTEISWMIPHFEKMLYDQALLATAALEAFAVSGETCFSDMAENIIRFVLRELSSPEGGFYCGLDADSEGQEGACYQWELDEIKKLLPEKEAGLVCKVFGVSEFGNSEEPGKNILFRKCEVSRAAAYSGLELSAAEEMFEESCRILLEARNRREQPLRDVKILSGWNGLMIAALARGAAVTGNRSWLDAAKNAVLFVRSNLVREDGRLLRSWCGSPSEIPAFLEDYAFLGYGCIELYLADRNGAYLLEAEKLCDDAIRLFRQKDGLFSTCGSDTEKLPLSVQEHHDGVVFAGTSALAMNLAMLARITGLEKWQTAAVETVNRLLPFLSARPVSLLWLLSAAQILHGGTTGRDNRLKLFP